MAGYVRQSAGLIVNGATILASHHEDEYTALASSFDGTTGHSHTGASGEGAKIALTTSVTGTLPIANGGTAATTDSGARTALGLEIGTDVQAYDAALASIVGLTTAADKMVYTTALDTYAVTDLTSFARTILDDADAAAVRTTIGLSDMATQDSSNVSITGGSVDADLTSSNVDITGGTITGITFDSLVSTTNLISRQNGGTAGTDEIQIRHDGSNGFITSQSGNLRLDAAGLQLSSAFGVDIYFDGSGNFYPSTANQINLGTAGAPFGSATIADLAVTQTVEVTPISIDNTDSPYTLSADAYLVLVDTSSGAVEIDLPAVASNTNRVLYIKDTGNASTNNITLDPNASEEIDGETSFVVDGDYDSIALISNGTEWLTL